MAQRKLKNAICFFVMLHEMSVYQGVSPDTEKQRTISGMTLRPKAYRKLRISITGERKY